MPGPAGQELRDRRRRTATLLSKYIKESAQAWDGARGGELIAVNTAEQVEPTTNYHLEETEKLHVHTWQWHLTGVSLPATAPRTAWLHGCMAPQV